MVALPCALMLAGAYAADEEYLDVVYLNPVSGNNKNTGASAGEALASLPNAYRKLGPEGGTIVLCGKLTLSSSSLIFPVAKDRHITITGIYGSEDFSKNAIISAAGSITLNGDTTFENLTFTATDPIFIFCNGNNVTFGEGLDFNGSNPPTIIGGSDASASGATVSSCTHYNYTIRIDSGTWNYVNGGNYRPSSYENGTRYPVGMTGNVSVIINGGTFKARGSSATDRNVISAGGGSAKDGDYYLEINGGTINCSVFGISYSGTNETNKIAANRGDLNIKITGGSFSIAAQRIAAIQKPLGCPMDGNFNLEIAEGVTIGSIYQINAAGVLGYSFADVKAAVVDMLSGFSGTVYVNGAGNDEYAGNTPNAPLKTVSAAAAKLGENGGVIVVCGNVDVTDETLPQSKKPVKITGRWNGNDYNTAINLTGTLNAGGDIYFDNITLNGLSNAVISGGGHNVKMLSGVKTSAAGDTFTEISLDGGDGESSHALTIYGGVYKRVSGGTSEKGSVSVILYDGTVNERLCGAEKSTLGSANVIIYGGTVNGNIYAARAGAGGDAGIVIAGGTINSPKVAASYPRPVYGDCGVLIYGGQLSPATVFEANEVKGKAFYKAPEGMEARFKNFSAAQAAVYVSDYGNGDGSSPASPVSTLKEAYRILGEEGGTIVISGEYTITDDFAAAVHLENPVTVTSVFGGIDYRISNGAMLKLYADYRFGGETTFDNIYIYGCDENASLSANCNKTVIGGGVECGIWHLRGVRYYPTIAGGSVLKASGSGASTAVNLTINGGTWGFVYGGNSRPGSVSGTLRAITDSITLNINGGSFTELVCANGANDQREGDVELAITGGYFDCSVFGSARAGTKVTDYLTVSGDTYIKITGGTFCGDIGFAQNESVQFKGHFSLELLAGDFTRVNSVRGTAGLKGGGTSELNLGEGLDLAGKIDGEISFTNPVADYADPSVFYHGGYYYYTYSKDYNGKPACWMTRTPNLCDIGNSEPICVWSSSNDGTAQDITSLWAPQLYYLNGKWYVYATCATTGTDEAARRQPRIWESKTDNPLEGFKYYGTFDNLDTTVWSYLSPRIIDWNGQLYLVCGGFFREGDKVPGSRHIQSIFMGKLSSPTAMSGKMVKITTGEYAWEGYAGYIGIVEGPYPLYAPDGETLYLIYAAGHTRLDEYCTGILKFKGTPATQDIANASLWEKQKTPLQFVDYTTGVFSPGAMVVTYTPDGSQLWAVFHAKNFTDIEYTLRRIYIMPITWDGNYPKIAPAQPVDTVYTIPKNFMPIGERIENDSFGSVAAKAYTPEEKPSSPVYDFGQPPADTDIVNGSAGSLLWAILAGAAALLAIGAAVVLIILKKRRGA